MFVKRRVVKEERKRDLHEAERERFAEVSTKRKEVRVKESPNKSGVN